MQTPVAAKQKPMKVSTPGAAQDAGHDPEANQATERRGRKVPPDPEA